MKTNAGKLIALLAGLAVLLLFVVNSQPVHHYISVLKSEVLKVDRPIDADEELRQQIESWRTKVEAAPIDARLDRVWKAVPGYNGRTVDIEASIARMKSSGKVTPEQLVYKQVAPNVSLQQLGAHPIYRGNPQKPAVSFMINVAWGNEHLDSILDTLDHYGVKTTFFLDGSWVRRFPELAKKIAERGHEIGNHAYSHPNMSKISQAMMRQELGKTQEIIKKTIGITPSLFAPPSGDFSQTVVNIAHSEFEMKTILWTADTVDWNHPPVAEMVKRIDAKLGNGVLVLMHPTPETKQGLPQLIQLAKAKGLTPTTVSEVISSQRLDVP